MQSSPEKSNKTPTHLCCVIIVVLKLPVFVQKEEDIHFIDADDLRGGLAYMSTTVMRAVSIESSRLYGTASVCSFFFYKYLLNFLFEGMRARLAEFVDISVHQLLLSIGIQKYMTSGKSEERWLHQETCKVNNHFALQCCPLQL